MKVVLQMLFLLCWLQPLSAQTGSLRGTITHGGQGIEAASIVLIATGRGATADSAGNFFITGIKPGRQTIKISAVGYTSANKQVIISALEVTKVNIEIFPFVGDMDAVVVTGTMKPSSKTNSPIPVEIYTPKFFQKNPTPNLFEAVGLVNGVKPQLNCNVCNTGDIHINGMEGPYTLVLIDGMPIVSALSTVYGLSGIPNSMVERIEVVKGPAASLYGSEAMGGIINVITKNPVKAPLLSADVFATSWQEYNADASVKLNAGKAQALLGINYFNYQNRLDKNKDGFTDVTLQNRLSVFNKWNFSRKENRAASIGLRYVNENRFGGQMNWNKKWQGGDSIYGESIYTKRFELIGAWQLPLKEKILFQYSYNWHKQDSYYGTTPYLASQQVTFGQLYWDKNLNSNHDLLLGASFRYTYYDDNTPATANADSLNPKNKPAKTALPGLFAQHQWSIAKQHTLLTGYRYDYDRHHGSIHSPRMAYKWAPDKNNTVRISFGTGFRVVNLFTEDHAALTGARQVVIAEALKPEQSVNSNINYVLKIPFSSFFIGLDATAFYSYFSNRITGDFDTDPNKIIYDNLKGHAVSQGFSLNTEASFSFPLKLMVGFTYLDVYQKEKDSTGRFVKNIQLFAPSWSGNFLISYTLPHAITIDLTGTFTGPMRLPIQPNDYRPEYSPWFSLANVQFSKKFSKGIELYAGAKNIFNFVPRHSLMRPFDPFDKTAADPVTNPQGYTFDTGYNYAPIQGIRGFLGMRYTLAN